MRQSCTWHVHVFQLSVFIFQVNHSYFFYTLSMMYKTLLPCTRWTHYYSLQLSSIHDIKKFKVLLKVRPKVPLILSWSHNIKKIIWIPNKIHNRSNAIKINFIELIIMGDWTPLHGNDNIFREDNIWISFRISMERVTSPQSPWNCLWVILILHDSRNLASWLSSRR